jgi:hypothetical protein
MSVLELVIYIIYFLVFFFLVFAISENYFTNDLWDKKLLKYSFYYKILIGLFFSLIYDFYYARGGDSFYYFYNSVYLSDMMASNPKAYFMILFDRVNSDNIYSLGEMSYWPPLNDVSRFAVHRYISPFTILGLKNYYITTLCLNAFMFILNWKAYRFFAGLFPERRTLVAVAILFIPSVTFWSSGIVKDTFTYSFGLLFLVYFYKILFQHKWSVFNILWLLFSAYMVMSIKPYILYAMIASGIVWLGFANLHRIRNRVIRVFVLPLMILTIGFGGLWTMNAVMQLVGGQYGNIDAMLQKAVIAQQDLKQEYYQGSSFDIGDYDPSIEGALSVTPAAVVAGLYRPFLWESRSAVMLLSGLENLAMLLLTLYVFFRVGFRQLFRSMGKNPFLIFCFVFSISIALGVGLSTSNFGALVRFKIPLIPFLFLGLMMVVRDFKEENLKMR